MIYNTVVLLYLYRTSRGHTHCGIAILGTGQPPYLQLSLIVLTVVEVTRGLPHFFSASYSSRRLLIALSLNRGGERYCTTPHITQSIISYPPTHPTPSFTQPTHLPFLSNSPPPHPQSLSTLPSLTYLLNMQRAFLLQLFRQHRKMHYQGPHTAISGHCPDRTTVQLASNRHIHLPNQHNITPWQTIPYPTLMPL